MDDIFDAIVVGGGLSGLAAAYTLAKEGKEVLVLERGDYCGAKNVTGGRMYVAPIRDMFPDLWKKAPFERAVTREDICLMAPGRSIDVSYSGRELGGDEPQSYTVQRAKFDKWLAKQASRAGAMIVTNTRVDGVVKEGGRVVGVRTSSGEELRANVVIACDGVLSFTAQSAGMKPAFRPQDYAVGVKEVVELDAKTIEERFGLAPGEGCARLFMGDATAGQFGGGFLYTNESTVSIGLVAGIADFCEDSKYKGLTAPDMMERFKQRPEVARLIEGGETVEYSAHVISEAGKRAFSRLSGDGILVCGDAAGFAMNVGLLVRGMEYAMASGHLAARAVLEACEKGDYGAAALGRYDELVGESFVGRDFESFKAAPDVLDRPYLFERMPEVACGLMGDLFAVPAGRPKDRIWATVKRDVPFREVRAIVKNVGGFRKL